MSLFGFGKSNKSDPPAAGAGTGDFASGSEQDRYASHFSGVGEVAADKIKAGAKKAANYKGDGAEQDRYGAHFSGLGLDEQQVHRAAQSMKSGLGGYWGLGYDGQQRAKKLAGGTAMGAEQDRFGSHFAGVDGKDVKKTAHSVKETVKEATIGGR